MITLSLTGDIYELVFWLVVLAFFTANAKLITEILKELLKFLKADAQPVAQARVDFYAFNNGKIERVDNMFLKVTQALPLAVAFTDAKGNPAKVEGAPAWAVTDASLASLVVAEDGMSATLTPMGPLGLCKVQVTADADLGAGVVNILGEMDIETIAGDAVAVNISAGEPVNV
jgi:hypothetical protein